MYDDVALTDQMMQHKQSQTRSGNQPSQTTGKVYVAHQPRHAEIGQTEHQARCCNENKVGVRRYVHNEFHKFSVVVLR